MAVTLVIADDHSMVRQSLQMYFEADPDISIIGEARDGAEAVKLARALQPDVVLMDLLMPALDGTHATAAIRRELPYVEVVAMTSVMEEAAIPGAIEAGAISYVLKDTQPQELRKALLAAGAGQVRFSLETAERLLRDVSAPTCRVQDLADRDLTLLQAVGSGLSNAEIAAASGMDGQQVRQEVHQMLLRLGVAGRAQALLCGISGGVVPADALRRLGLEAVV